MRETILKAVAMPPRVFWAPMMPAVLNFVIQMALFFIALGLGVDPLWLWGFIFSFVGVHIILVAYAFREPHLSKMMQSQGQISKPNKQIYPDKGKKLAS